MAQKIAKFTDPYLDRQIEIIINAINKPVIQAAGSGVVVRTPDGSTLYLIAVDNSGNVTVTDVTSEFA